MGETNAVEPCHGDGTSRIAFRCPRVYRKHLIMEEMRMNYRLLVSVAAIALIGGAGAVNAQGGMNREGGAATQQSAPSGGGTAGGAATQKNTEHPSGMKSTQTEPKSPGAAKGPRAEDNARGEKSKNLNTQNETRGRDTGMKAEQRQGREKNLNAEGGGGRETQRSQTTTGQAGAGAKMSTEQRTRITTVIRNEHVAPINDVDFSIAVGTRVPRERISLRALPAQVITIYPEWRGYEFFLIRDEIVVVDPRTLEIVAVLPA
jgi:hypothetical protein